MKVKEYGRTGMQVVVEVGAGLAHLSGLKAIVMLYIAYSVYLILPNGSLVDLPLTHHHSIASFSKVNTMTYSF